MANELPRLSHKTWKHPFLGHHKSWFQLYVATRSTIKGPITPHKSNIKCRLVIAYVFLYCPPGGKGSKGCFYLQEHLFYGLSKSKWSVMVTTETWYISKLNEKQFRCLTARGAPSAVSESNPGSVQGVPSRTMEYPTCRQTKKLTTLPSRTLRMRVVICSLWVYPNQTRAKTNLSRLCPCGNIFQFGQQWSPLSCDFSFWCVVCG